MSSEHFPNDSKPVDVGTRAFHRINAPNYDVAVDSSQNRRGAKSAPDGRARDSGARGPEAFKDSGFLEKVTKLLGKLLTPLIGLIPFVGPLILLVNAFLGKVIGKDPINSLIEALGKLISNSVEGALFARYLRSIPSWVPVGRKLYDNADFTYAEDGDNRKSTKEEEREIEGVLAGSYALMNDVVFTQWSHFRHWSFQVLPAAGFRYLVGNGNIPDPAEQEFINRTESFSNSPEFREVLSIYGQQGPSAIECIMDIGAISKPIGDGGTHGVMFDPLFPYWPMTGDHFWAAGRWAYDCMRASGKDTNEVFPTQINPIKAFAASRFEGFKFPENNGGAPAVRFFFFATTEGGYTEFRQSTDRFKKTHTSGITFGDRDYEFIVDLPPRDGDRQPYPIGATINFPLNRLVLRPRLLFDVKQAPFAIGGQKPQFADNLQFLKIDPRIEVLRPKDPNKFPSQVRITIPMKSLTAPSDPEKPQAIGLDITIGWHDPNGDDTSKWVKVNVKVHEPLFFSQGGDARLVTGVNGRWNMLAKNVNRTSGDPAQSLPPVATGAVIQNVDMFLPGDAPLSVISSGTWRHGFGEFMEGNTQRGRILNNGLFSVDPATKDKINKFLKDARQTVKDIQDASDTIKNPKPVLKAQLQKKLDELKASGADPTAVAALQKQIDSMVDALPDTPEGIQDALKQLDKGLGAISDAIEAVEDFIKLTNDLITEKFSPGWHEDIDTATKTGVEESARVSAIARSMFLHPTPIVNKADEPMGWAEFVDTNRTPIGRNSIGALVTPSGRNTANVQSLFDLQNSSGNASTRIRMAAARFSLAGSGNNLAEVVNPPQKRTDYDMEVEVTITPA